MPDEQEAVLLRIYVKEGDKWQGKPLYIAIVEEAHKQGLAGATVLRGTVGYGSSNEERQPLELSSDPPMVVEIVDWEDKAESFVQGIAPMIERGLVTEEKVNVLWYRSPRRG